MSITPTWEHYGTHDDSAYPELWEGCIGAWCPGLGPTGLVVPNLARTALPGGAFVDLSAATGWEVDGGAYCALTTSNTGYVDFGFTFPSMSELTQTAWIRKSSGARAVILAFVGGTGQIGFELYETTAYTDVADGVYGYFNSNLTGWHHWTLVFCGPATGNSNRLKAYVDGIEMAMTYQGTVGTTIGPSVHTYGTRRSGYSPIVPVARYDDILVFNRALAAGEVEILARQRAIAYTPRRQRRFYSIPAGFPFWARQSTPRVIGGGLV